MNATERAARLMQVITSLGVRQFVVLPFGVTNGPPYFQEAMLDLYGGTSRGLDNLLADGLQDLDACMEIFVDDITVGNGDAQMDVSVVYDDILFENHMVALERVFARARALDLLFILLC